jgi:hypothetical protein
MANSATAASRVVALALAASLLTIAVGAAAQKRPADLTALPPTPTTYTPKKTAWGDWDFRGTWPMDHVAGARILFQRPKGFGDRVWLTDEEHAKRVANAEKSDAGYSAEDAGIQQQAGTQGQAEWTRTSDFSWRTSLLVSPRDGQLPPLTPQAQKLFENGRSGWVPGQEYDTPADFDAWDRCITRGFPASMLPNRYNHGLQVFQSPGYIVIVNEMLGRRVIPIVPKAEVGRHWPKQVEAWWGNSRAYWDGKTLVIETANLKSGDSVTYDLQKRAAAPVIVTMVGGAPLDTIPVSAKAHAVEKLTMTGPDSILYEVTYDDPEVFTAPWTAQEEWDRNDEYQMFEYACLEGDVQIRGYISASRAARAQIAAGTRKPETIDKDSRSRFTKTFDFDPVAPGSPPPGAGGAQTAANGG